MKKETLIKFIDKYNLGDRIKMVNWKVTPSDKILRTRGEIDSRMFIADVTLKDFVDITDAVRIPIASTQKVKAMLSPFEDDLTITLNKDGDRIKGFYASTKDCESYCTAAEPSAIPPVSKDITDTIVYDVEISLTDEFVGAFLKAKAALNDVEEFTIKMNSKDQVEFVIGYSAANTNRINLVAPTKSGKDKLAGNPIKFPAGNVVEVLKANKEMGGGTAFLSSNGVLKFVYDNPQFSCLYYQFASVKKS